MYTNETNLYFDLTISTYRISPLFDGYGTCFTVVTRLTTAAIVLIVVVSVLSFITIVLIGICLKKQLIELYHILINWLYNTDDTIPRQTIHGTPSGEI